MNAGKIAGSDMRAIEGVRRRFERWRRGRSAGSRIPKPLWAAAVELADSCGVHPIARALRLDYYSLKKRVEVMKRGPRRAPASSAHKASFLELPAPTGIGVPECVLELENAEGAKMRIHWKGGEAPDLATLSQSFWESQS